MRKSGCFVSGVGFMNELVDVSVSEVTGVSEANACLPAVFAASHA